MFLLTLDNTTRLLRKLIDVIKEIANDQKVLFEIDDRGLMVQALDVARVCVLSLHMGPMCFNKFETSTHQIICLNTAMLIKVLKCSAIDTEPELEMSWDGTSDNVRIRAPQSQASFELPLFHAGDASERFELPEPDHVLSFDSNELASTIKDLALFGDTATFETATDGSALNISVSNTAGMRARLRLVPKDPFQGFLAKDPISEAKATFALSYLTSMVKASALSDVLSIELQRDRPLTMEAALLSGRGYVRMYLAPKVDDGASDDETNDDED